MAELPLHVDWRAALRDQDRSVRVPEAVRREVRRQSGQLEDAADDVQYAVGRGVGELVTTGGYETIDLEPLCGSRFTRADGWRVQAHLHI